MNIAIPDRFQLAADFEQRANSLSFSAEVWNVAAELAEANKAITPSELEVLTGQSFDQVRDALKQLLAKKLVKQDLFTWKEFTAAREKARSAAKAPVGEGKQEAAPAAKIGPATATPTPAQQVAPAIAVAIKPAQSQAAVPAAVAASTSIGSIPAKEGVALRLGSISPSPQPAFGASSNPWGWQKSNTVQVAASSTVSPVVQPQPQPQAKPSTEQSAEGRLLRPLLAQIENIKGGGVEGQLLVYQVFLRVPYQLLYDEGIKSLHFVDERTVIKNPALLAAIIKAAKDVAGVDLA